MRPPGKSGLTFDHILSRLQGELQKSRDTGTELHTLTGAMNDIHDTLGGTLVCRSLNFFFMPINLNPPFRRQPPNLPPYPHALPPVRQSQQPPATDPSTNPNASTDTPEQPSAPPPSTLNELQTQLHDTQSSLANHVDKVRALEGVLKEQEAIKHEVGMLRELVESRRREMEVPGTSHGHGELEPRGGFDLDNEGDEEREVEEGGETDDDDDARSINTVVPHELDPVEEEDEDQLALAAQDELALEHEDEGEPDGEEEDEEEDRRRRREELGRPRTPEPTGMGMGIHGMDDYESRRLLAAPRRHSSSPTTSTSSAQFTTSSLSHHTQMSTNVIGELTTRLTTLASQLESALSLSSTLQAQHAAAQSTISALESKVDALEEMVKTTQRAQAVTVPTASSSSDARTTAGAGESSGNTEREDKESLTQILNDWKKGMEGQWSNIQEEWNQERERLSKAREEWEGKVKQVDSSLVALQTRIQSSHGGFPNGDAKHNGLVTPPSPRSLSADSNRPRMRRKRSGSSRGRSGSRSRSLDVDTMATSEDFPSKSGPRTSSPTSIPFSHDVEKEEGCGERSLATPEPSVHTMSSSMDSVGGDTTTSSPVTSTAKGDLTQRDQQFEDLVRLS